MMASYAVIVCLQLAEIVSSIIRSSGVPSSEGEILVVLEASYS